MLLLFFRTFRLGQEALFFPTIFPAIVDLSWYENSTTSLLSGIIDCRPLLLGSFASRGPVE